MPNQTIGDIIRELRTAIDVTQRELAALMGVSGSAVEAHEQGLRSPNTRALAMLCDVARDHQQEELAEIFQLHEFVSWGDTHPEFRFLLPGLARARQSIGRALADEMVGDPELFSGVAKSRRCP